MFRLSFLIVGEFELMQNDDWEILAVRFRHAYKAFPEDIQVAISKPRLVS